MTLSWSRGYSRAREKALPIGLGVEDSIRMVEREAQEKESERFRVLRKVSSARERRKGEIILF